METLNYTQQLKELAMKLVTPERFGRLAMAPLVELPLPETARIYDFPASSGESA